jgi:hypothetical protein
MKTQVVLIQEIESILQEFKDLKAKNIQWTDDNFYILKRLAKRGIDKAIEVLNS